MKGNILFVDDSRSVRNFLGKLLHDAGYAVLSAENGERAWEILQGENVDLIVSDLVMPVMNGMELCGRVKQDRDLKNIYFIILSTKSEVDTKVSGFSIGADDYIVKTTKEGELLARIHAGMRIRALEKELQEGQSFMFHAEKMATIGQITAGVAHEINNPLSFIASNLNTLSRYSARLIEYMQFQEDLVARFGNDEAGELLWDRKKKLKMDIVIGDLPDLIRESLEGTDRVKKIVQDLKSFSRVDETDFKLADINECLESTLNIARNELKYKTMVNRNYGKIPLVKCFPQQLNQVFMNLLVNAAQAIEVKGEISIATKEANGSIFIAIADTGCGMPQEIISKVTQPFFTTKGVGKGTGIGLSISLDIIKKHKGELLIESEVGKGSIFTIRIPIVTEEGQQGH